MSLRLKIYIVIFLNHLLAFIGLYFLWNIKLLVLTLLGWLLFGKVGGEAGFHRLLAHRSFFVTPVKKKILILLGCLNCFGSPLGWATIHRAHHHHADTELDPHGKLSFLRVWITAWRQPRAPLNACRDLFRDDFVLWCHEHYFGIISLTWIALLPFGVAVPIYLISLPAIITFHSAGLVNTICHRWGYRNFQTSDTSYNNSLVNIITLGSGLHNNHHYTPSSWKTNINWYEIDVVGIFVRIIKDH
jgi:fatty-acid desaturase